MGPVGVGLAGVQKDEVKKWTESMLELIGSDLKEENKQKFRFGSMKPLSTQVCKEKEVRG